MTTWNPLDKNANITLSNGNLTASASAGGDNLVRSTTSKTTGVWYWEVQQDHQGSEDSPGGIGTANENLSNFAGQTADSTGWYGAQFYCNGILNNFLGWNPNDWLGFVLDTTGPVLTIRNLTQGLGPATVNLFGNSGGHNINASPWFALADVPAGSTNNVNFAGPFVGTIPGGAQAWDPPAAAPSLFLLGRGIT